MLRNYILLTQGILLCCTAFWAVIFWGGRTLLEQKIQSNNNYPTRKWAGLLAAWLCLGYADCILGWYAPFHSPEKQNILFLIDTIAVPICVLICYLMTHTKAITDKTIISHFTPFVCAILVYSIFQKQIVFDIIIGLVAVYIAIQVIRILSHAKHYDQELENLYSTTYGRSAKWLIFSMLMMAVQGIAWVCTLYVRSPYMVLAYYIISIILWNYTFISALRMIVVQEDSPTMVFKDALEDLESESLAEPTPSSEFLNLLQEKCIKTEMYTHEDLTRDELAYALHLNPSRFTRQLREATGKSFYEYINGLRVEHAAKLLREDSTMDIGSIGYTAGYKYRSTFYRAFATTYGCTPAEYRAKQKKEA